ncbi:RsfA family transcription factor [Natronobacillus azotifigens]|uniref:RsfA family transcriptional regulator n=1 Tax=Natronobacillus azotifigens TaxID=472978 RepID=A0A9J6RF26_9BACI|nr:RsfA family transcriptional regulator [Natronobacillus azotifigens]MCZ0703998.1 RsfA family transcriptional regulator [Natronobacillus azotifigens]
MNTSRQDAWTKDEDALLAETVLNYIREGKTQLEAFREVAKRLSRTPAACGFRWNASVRKVYENAVEQAKKDRKKVTITEKPLYTDHSTEQITLEAAISLLEKVKGNVLKVDQAFSVDQEKYQSLVTENKQLKEQLQAYQVIINEINGLISKIDEQKEKTLL